MDTCVVRRLHTVSFRPKIEGSQTDFSAQPVRVHFHELLGTSDAPELVPQVDNQDVLRAVVALFDGSLPDVGTEYVHDTVHSHGAHTILLLRQQSDVLEEYRCRTPPYHPLGDPPPTLVIRPTEPESNLFHVFSESEESSDEEEEEEEEVGAPRSPWDIFCSGMEDYLVNVRERRLIRNSPEDSHRMPPTAIGIESLIVGAATFQLKALRTGVKVLQLSLLATRKRYRNCGVGRYLIELMKSQSMCPSYDAFLAHADPEAVAFFSRCGLTDDALLNERFREVRDDWTNTTLMSYLPPFTTESNSRNPGFALILPELELEVSLAKTAALVAYQQQAVCVIRLVAEVKTLREQLELQRREVDELNDELDREKARRHEAELQLLQWTLKKAQQLLESQEVDSDEDPDLTPSDPSVCPPSSPLHLGTEV